MSRRVIVVFLIVACGVTFLALNYFPGPDIVEPSHSLAPLNGIFDDTKASLQMVDNNSSFIFIGEFSFSKTKGYLTVF